MVNCIVWGNSSGIYDESTPATVTYSIVQGGYSGVGNLNADPLFVNQPDYTSAPTTNGDLRLNPGSPAIDAGTASGAPSIDLDGKPRPIGNGFDMGAFEFGTPCPPTITFYYDADQDGYGENVSIEACVPTGLYTAAVNGDCNNDDPSIYPGAPETCNGVDDNCDGQKDEGFDLDGDSYTTCNGDCDDTNPLVYSAAIETCNGVDDDCDDLWTKV